MDKAKMTEALRQLFVELVKKEIFRVKSQNEYWRHVCDKAKELGLEPVELHEMIRSAMDEVLVTVFVPPAKKGIPAPGSAFDTH